MNYKAILKVDSYSFKDGLLVLKAEQYSVKSGLVDIVKYCIDKKSNYIKVELSPPYKKRSTGKDSQNSHIWGHITQIAKETGNDIDDVEYELKRRAIKRGYPYHINKLNGDIMPNSMKHINTLEASYLIEELHQLASELEIVLVEE